MERQHGRPVRALDLEPQDLAPSQIEAFNISEPQVSSLGNMKTNACLPAPPASQGHRRGQMAGSRCGGALTHLHTARSRSAAGAPPAPPRPPGRSPWSPTHRPAASGFHVLGFSAAGTVDHSLLLKPPSFLAAVTPASPPSSARLLCPFSLCDCPNPLACRPTLLLALLYPQTITTTLALNAICPQIK